MLIYIILPLIAVLLYVFLSRIKGGKKYYLIIMLAILAIVSGLRSYQIGADYLTYVKIFKNINSLINNYPMEQGYLYFNLLVASFSNSYIVLSVIINAFIFSSLYIFIRRNIDEKYYPWIIFIFIANPYLYIQGSFNIIRQAISTGIILFGINKLNEGKYIHFIASVIIASQFHSIGYIYSLLAIVRLIKWDKTKFIAISTISLLFNLFLGKSQILYSLAEFFNYGLYNGYKATAFNFWAFAVFVYVISLIIILNYEKIKTSDREIFFLNTYILSLSMLPIFITNDIMYRVYIGLVTFSLPGIAIILRHTDNKLNKGSRFIIKGMYASYYVLLLVLFLLSAINNPSYIPFKFFWQS